MKERVEEWKKKEVEKVLGVRFRSERLLLQAFTRDSYLTEHKETGLESYQRLEFLGDAVIGLISANYFYQRSQGNEGELTELRKKVADKPALAAAAGRMGLTEFLLVSHGEALTDGNPSPALLEDCFEAVTGAIFLDRGYKQAERFLRKHLFEASTQPD